jgi:hypothetical protein
MDRVNGYREVIRRVLKLYASWKPANGSIESEVVEDATRDHFELLNIGWEGHRRIHYTVLHLDIIGGKIWVQHDATDRPVVEELVAAGVPKSDIVLGFHPAELRQHTEFAVG